MDSALALLDEVLALPGAPDDPPAEAFAPNVTPFGTADEIVGPSQWSRSAWYLTVVQVFFAYYVALDGARPFEFECVFFLDGSFRMAWRCLSQSLKRCIAAVD